MLWRQACSKEAPDHAGKDIPRARCRKTFRTPWIDPHWIGSDQGAWALEHGCTEGVQLSDGCKAVGFDGCPRHPEQSSSFGRVRGNYPGLVYRSLVCVLGQYGEGISVRDHTTREVIPESENFIDFVQAESRTEDDDIVPPGVQLFGFGQNHFGPEAVKVFPLSLGCKHSD